MSKKELKSQAQLLPNTRNPQAVGVQDLPDEILLIIFSRVIKSPQDLLRIARVNRLFYQLADKIWNKFLHPDYQKEHYGEARFQFFQYPNSREWGWTWCLEDTLRNQNLQDVAQRGYISSDQEYPSSYEKIWQKGTCFLESAKYLLRDYTKDNSSAMRFFSGHWNRHHLEDVSAILDVYIIKDIDVIINRLLRIELKNQNGSLATRIKFICNKYSAFNEKIVANEKRFMPYPAIKG
ncbi:MAG: hypothetical protein K0S08_1528 [Gammaproteobacteria bacterium]|jgi:hypothetical protein|nr:hypothetical protein [Gammaproteobacteria bacterium]